MSLTIATGIKTLDLHGVSTVQVSFNPTDINFVEQLYSAFNALEKKNEERREKVLAMENAEAFEFCREIDAEMRSVINDVFGTDVCTPIFGNMNVYAMADGARLWENLLFAIIEQCDDAMAAERLKENPRIKKYLDKYKKK